MSTKRGFICDKCHLKVVLATSQPSYIMAGEVLEKYCPKTREFTYVFRSIWENKIKIGCLDKKVQEEFYDATPCQNCSGECLQDIEIIEQSGCDQEGEKYRCPACGGVLQLDPYGPFIMAD